MNATLFWATVTANPLEFFFTVTMVASLYALWVTRKMQLKRRVIAGAFLSGSVFAFVFLTSHEFRATLATQAGVNASIADCLAFGIHQAGFNLFSFTPQMESAFVIMYGLAAVVYATSTKRWMGWLIALGTTLFLISTIWGTVEPILRSLTCV